MVPPQVEIVDSSSLVDPRQRNVIYSTKPMLGKSFVVIHKQETKYYAPANASESMKSRFKKTLDEIKDIRYDF